MSRAPGSHTFRSKNVTLHLGKSNVPMGKAAILMKDRVLRVFPSLIDQSPLGRTLIFDKAVLVGVPGAIDPSKRSVNRWPELSKGLVVAGPFGIQTRE